MHDIESIFNIKASKVHNFSLEFFLTLLYIAIAVSVAQVIVYMLIKKFQSQI